MNGYTIVLEDSVRGKAGGVALCLSLAVPSYLAIQPTETPLVDWQWVNTSASLLKIRLMRIVYWRPKSTLGNAR